jgi:hypothetical protein
MFGLVNPIYNVNERKIEKRKTVHMIIVIWRLKTDRIIKMIININPMMNVGNQIAIKMLIFNQYFR